MTTGPTAARDLVGQWRLVSFVEYDPQGRPHPGPLGSAPRGSLCYGADGYVSVHLMRTDAAPPPATAYIGYTGIWWLADGKVVHQVRIAADPTWADTRQVRDVSLSGDHLVLRRRATVDGQPVHGRLDWHRC